MPTIRDTFVAKESIGPVTLTLPTISELFVAREAVVTESIGATLKDVFVATDATTVDSFVHVHEVFTATDATTATATITHTQRDVFVAGDAVYGLVGNSAQLSEVAILSETIREPTIRVSLADSFVATETATPSAQLSAYITDRFVAHDYLTRQYQVMVSDSFVALDATSVEHVAYAKISEKFVATESLSQSIGGVAYIADKFFASETVSPAATILGQIHDVFFVYDVAQAKSDSYSLGPTLLESDVLFGETEAWTAHVATWGMSRYAGLPVREWVPGEQFGFGPGGVYTADPTPVFSYYETGDLRLDTGDFATTVLKRPSNVYTFGRQDAEGLVLATGDIDGVRTSHEYTQDASGQAGDRAVRCTVGRGFATTYMRLRVGGALHYLTRGAEVEAKDMRRRI